MFLLLLEKKHSYYAETNQWKLLLQMLRPSETIIFGYEIKDNNRHKIIIIMVTSSVVLVEEQIKFFKHL